MRPGPYVHVCLSYLPRRRELPRGFLETALQRDKAYADPRLVATVPLWRWAGSHLRPGLCRGRHSSVHPNGASSMIDGILFALKAVVRGWCMWRVVRVP